MIYWFYGAAAAGASLALAFWSYIPLYALPVAIGACLLKVPIEVEDPQNSEHGKHYLLDVQMSMTAILKMNVLTWVPKSATLRRNRSLIHSQSITRNLCYSLNVRECFTVANSTVEPALLLKSGAAKT